MAGDRSRENRLRTRRLRAVIEFDTSAGQSEILPGKQILLDDTSGNPG